MKCKKCGAEIGESDVFCPKCGKKVTRQSDKSTPIPVKYLGIIAAVLVCIVAMIAITMVWRNKETNKKTKEETDNFSQQLDDFEAYCSTYQLGDMKEEYDDLVENSKSAIEKSDKSEYAVLAESFEKFETELTEYLKQVEGYGQKEEEYQSKFAMLQMTDEQEKTYSTLVEELNSGLSEGSLSVITSTTDELDRVYEDYKNENLNLIENKKEEMEDYSLSNCLEAELQILEGYKKNTENYVEDGNYRQALAEYENYISLCQDIENAESFEFHVEQIDGSSFPNIKLYISAYGANAESIEIDTKNLVLKQLSNNVYNEITIADVSKLNEKENLNICLVADVSGSMYEQIENVKTIMTSFANCLQYSVGDQVSLITFDDTVNLNLDFTNSNSEINREIQDIAVGNCTALYDALYVGVCKASGADGAKCVIAFTDGYDNVSTKTAEDVIQIANSYEVPVYLIGIGDSVDTTAMQQISNSTGGFYQNVYDESEMLEVYNAIYKESKEMYMITYTSPTENADDLQNLYLSYHSENCFMHCESSFQPSQLQAHEDEYTDLIQDIGVKNADIEDEVLRIRGIYNDIVNQISKNQYDVSTPAEGIETYSENGEVRCVIINKGVDNCQYARYYYYENNKLIFAYIEASDSHRLYFKNDKLFRWRYAVDAVEFSEADNHDNEDSAEFRVWESFALNEAYLYTAG